MRPSHQQAPLVADADISIVSAVGMTHAPTGPSQPIHLSAHCRLLPTRRGRHSRPSCDGSRRSSGGSSGAGAACSLTGRGGRGGSARPLLGTKRSGRGEGQRQRLWQTNQGWQRARRQQRLLARAARKPTPSRGTAQQRRRRARRGGRERQRRVRLLQRGRRRQVATHGTTCMPAPAAMRTRMKMLQLPSRRPQLAAASTQHTRPRWRRQQQQGAPQRARLPRLRRRA